MIYVFLAHGFEEIEALTPVDVLRRAGLEVRMVGIGQKRITGSHGITVECDLLDTQISTQEAEMIVLPGGMPGTLELERAHTVQKLVDFCAQNNRWIAAICAAPQILGHKGLLAGKRATCFPGIEKHLAGAQTTQDFLCVDGMFITARGMGVATEFALKLVEVLTSPEQARALAGTLQCRG